MSNPYSKPCSREYKAAHKSGRRSLDKIKYIVIHCTESGDARSAARWFTNEESGGSAHLVIDDEHCFRTLLDSEIPWAAPPLNSNGFHVELAGYARWTRDVWEAHEATLLRASYKVAQRCVQHGIPIRWVGPWGLKLRRKGITTHADVSKAFKQSDHSDPGLNFPKRLFIEHVRYFAELIKNGV